MALIFKPYQPVIFESEIIEKNYLGPIDSIPLIDLNDVSTFQVESTPGLNSSYLIQDEKFDDIGVWDLNSSWNYNNGIEYTGGGNDLFQLGVFEIGPIHKLTIHFENLNTGFIDIYFGTNLIASFSSPGTYEIFGISSDNETISFLPSDTLNIGAKIIKAEAQTLENNCEGKVLFIDETEISILNKVNSLNSITYSIDWSLIDTSGKTGCVKFGISNECNSQILNNSDFKGGSANWIAGSNFSFSDNLLLFENMGGGTTLAQSNILEIGMQYKIIIGIPVIEDLGGITIFSDAGLPPINITNGFGEATFTANTTTLNLLFSAGGSSEFTKIGYISLFKVIPEDPTSYVFSNFFNYGDHENNSILLRWANNENAFNFIYNQESLFYQNLRIFCKKSKPNYNSERQITDDIYGNRYKRFFKTNKSEVLTISPYDEIIHDSISLIGGHDIFFIDNQQYEINQEGYTPDWDTNSDYVASSELEVVKVPVSLTKVRCVSGFTSLIP